MRWLLFVLVACSSHADHADDRASEHGSDRTPDPAVGRWSGDNERVFELRADGTLDIAPITDRACEGAPASVVAACRGRQTWSRTGTTIVFERGALTPPAATAASSPGACECRLEREQLELRGNELVAGKQRAVRIP